LVELGQASAFSLLLKAALLISTNANQKQIPTPTNLSLKEEEKKCWMVWQLFS
jgi:hypothetical protein